MEKVFPGRSQAETTNQLSIQEQLEVETQIHKFLVMLWSYVCRNYSGDIFTEIRRSIVDNRTSQITIIYSERVQSNSERSGDEIWK